MTGRPSCNNLLMANRHSGSELEIALTVGMSKEKPVVDPQSTLCNFFQPSVGNWGKLSSLPEEVATAQDVISPRSEMFSNFFTL